MSSRTPAGPCEDLVELAAANGGEAVAAGLLATDPARRGERIEHVGKRDVDALEHRPLEGSVVDDLDDLRRLAAPRERFEVDRRAGVDDRVEFVGANLDQAQLAVE